MTNGQHRDNAGVYFYGVPPTPSAVVAAATDAQTSVVLDGDETTIVVTWPDASVTLTIDPTWDRERQLSGIRGWLNRFPPEELDHPAVALFLEELGGTTTCYGTVIRPAYDSGGKVGRFILRLLRAADGGFIFTHQSFYDHDGHRLIGSPGDPARLLAG